MARRLARMLLHPAPMSAQRAALMLFLGRSDGAGLRSRHGAQRGEQSVRVLRSAPRACLVLHRGERTWAIALGLFQPGACIEPPMSPGAHDVALQTRLRARRDGC
jgi:hypothetical protein